MANTRVYSRAFAGGEISPEMFGRIDDARYQTGVAYMRNFIATPQGPAENRAGFQFVREVKTSNYKTRLIPFSYSTTQTMVIELGVNSIDSQSYMRFHTQGGTLLAPTVTATYKASATVTFSSALNNVTWTAHGFTIDTPVFFVSSAGMPSNMQANKIYYVTNPTTDTFQLKTSPTASLLTIGTVPSATFTGYYGYKRGDLIKKTVLTVTTVYYYRDPAGTPHTEPVSTSWYALPSTGEYEIPTHTQSGQSYQSADLFDIHYVQNADVLTLVHPYYQPMELRRYGATTWTMDPVVFGANLTAPTGVTATASLGSVLQITGITTASAAVFTTVGAHGLVNNDPIYIYDVGNSFADIPGGSGFFVVYDAGTPGTSTTFKLKKYDTGGPVSGVGSSYTGTAGRVTYWAKTDDPKQYYVVTAVNENLEESQQSAEVNCTNNLFVNGAYNTISWSAVPGAARYNVYKKQSGLFGYIGQTQATTFKDDNIAPDMGTTPPIYDGSLQSVNNFPGAVSYYEQRRCFAGTLNAPQSIWMTRSNTESDLSYSIPTKDNDRIAFRVAAREANTIRHIVPLQQMILLTNSAEWRVTSVNNDALTPYSISVRPQSYIGSNNVQPSVINNALVYCAARGGHVRELGYSWQSNGYITGDLSLRAAHLFDNYQLLDMCYSKSPLPLLWFVSSTGKLLGLTYIPEEQVGSWHQHDTDGTFESCTAVAEGSEDVLYVIVKRTIKDNLGVNTTKRYVERMASRQIASLDSAFFVDSGLAYNGINTDVSNTVALSAGSTWLPNDTVTATVANSTFTTGVNSPNLGDKLAVTSPEGVTVTITITQVVSPTQIKGTVDSTVPVSLRSGAHSTWSLARKYFANVGHLAGKTVSVLADGVVQKQQTVTLGGAVTLTAPAVRVVLGLPYECDLQTLPVVIQMEGFGQGFAKNVNKVSMRIYQTSEFYIGPDAGKLVKTNVYTSRPSFQTDEVDTVVFPSWAQGGQVYIRQSDPLPLTLVNLSTEIAIGGS